MSVGYQSSVGDISVNCCANISHVSVEISRSTVGRESVGGRLI